MSYERSYPPYRLSSIPAAAVIHRLHNELIHHRVSPTLSALDQPP